MNDKTRCIIMTGAASGIGAAAARLFHREGWKLGLLDLEADSLDALAKELGSRVSVKTADVRNHADVEKAIQALAEAMQGRVDVLLNSAGILRIGEFAELSMEDHRLTADVNFLGLMHTTYAAFPYLKQTPGAHVINMSSASAIYGVPDFASYSASKFAVRGLTEALNLEWEKYDIHVSDLMPSFVRSPMIDGQHQPVAMRRMGVNQTPEKIAREIFDEVGSRHVHRPVSQQVRWMRNLSRFTNEALTRRMMGLLTLPTTGARKKHDN